MLKISNGPDSNGLWVYVKIDDRRLEGSTSNERRNFWKL